MNGRSSAGQTGENIIAVIFLPADSTALPLRRPSTRGQVSTSHAVQRQEDACAVVAEAVWVRLHAAAIPPPPSVHTRRAEPVARQPP